MDMLDGALKKHQNNLLSTAEIIEELIRIAREVKAADKRGRGFRVKLSQYLVPFLFLLQTCRFYCSSFKTSFYNMILFTCLNCFAKL